jgi:hypothetical protein
VGESEGERVRRQRRLGVGALWECAEREREREGGCEAEVDDDWCEPEWTEEEAAFIEWREARDRVREGEAVPEPPAALFAHAGSTHTAALCSKWGLPFTCTALPWSPSLAHPRLSRSPDILIFEGVGTINNPPKWRWPERERERERETERERERGRQQVWAFADWRAAANYPTFLDPSFMGNFNVTIGQRRNYTIWSADILGSPKTAYKMTVERLREEGRRVGAVGVVGDPRAAGRRGVHAGPPFPTGDAYLAAFVSNCVDKAGRRHDLRTLASLVPTHSFGTCERNALLPASLRGGKSRYGEKVAALRHYPFAFAFENVGEADYVTEKVWNALEAGAVPVYWGAPNVADFLPHPSAILDVREYDSLEAVAEAITFYSTHHEELLARFHGWRSSPLPASLAAAIPRVRGYYECALCEWAMSTAIQRCWEDEACTLPEDLDL